MGIVVAVRPCARRGKAQPCCRRRSRRVCREVGPSGSKRADLQLCRLGRRDGMQKVVRLITRVEGPKGPIAEAPTSLLSLSAKVTLRQW
jgi:hypothetical protein